MAEWLSYSLSDMLLFSLPAYIGLFELLNTTLWPAHVLILALGFAAGAFLLKDHQKGPRLLWALLGLLWFWTGWTFLYMQYATINWAAAYVAPAFWLQGLLFGIFALLPKGPEIRYVGTTKARTATGLYLFSLIGYPAATVALGRPLDSVEFLGISVDPGVTATLAVLVLSRGNLAWLGWIMPLTWCALTGLTLWMLGSPEFFIAPLIAVLALVAVCYRRLPG